MYIYIYTYIQCNTRTVRYMTAYSPGPRRARYDTRPPAPMPNSSLCLFTAPIFKHCPLWGRVRIKRTTNDYVCTKSNYQQEDMAWF